MKKRFVVSWVSYLFLLSILVLPACRTSPEATTGPDQLIAAVEEGLSWPVFIQGDSIFTWSIEERMAHYGVPGLSVAVIKDEQVLWVKTYGTVEKDSDEKVTSQSLFQAASISKPVSAMAALKMVEEGLLDADADINDQLVSWKLPENQFTTDNKVTLKHLLSHTGGITVHGFLGYHPGLEVPGLLQVLNGEEPANSPPIRIDKKPGESFRYSGGGYCIAQQMMIDVAGKTYPEILQEKVLGPLGMTLSTFEQPLPSERLSQATTGYLPNGGMTKGRRHTYPEMAAAGLWTNAEELAKFAIELQKAHRGASNKVLSQAMVENMLTPIGEEFIGLGIFLNKKGSSSYFEHGGWNEGFSSQLIAGKDNGFGAVVMINANKPAFIDELINAIARVYEWPDYALVYEQSAEKGAQKNVLGRYRMGKDQLARVFEEDSKMYLQIDAEVALELLPVGEGVYTRRERTNQVHFKEKEGAYYLDFIDPWQGGDFTYQYSRMSADEKVPLEYLLEGQFDEALQRYQTWQKADSQDEHIQEDRINELGYEALQAGHGKLAIDVFRINTELYPEGFNTYDSLGEAYLAAGDTTLAIKNYKKSVALNPENTHAAEVVARLEQR